MERLKTKLIGLEAEEDSDNLEQRLKIQHLRNLLAFLEEEFEPVRKKRLLLQLHITFDLLWDLFPAGSEILFKDEDSGLMCGGEV